MSVDEKLQNYIDRFDRVFKNPNNLQEENSNKPQENKKVIIRYLRQAKTNGISDETLKQRYEAFTIFSDLCNISFSQLTKDDVVDFLCDLDEYTFTRSGKDCTYSPSSKQVYRIILRQFFKSDYFKNPAKDEIISAIKILKQAELEKAIERHKEGNVHKEILTEEDVWALIDGARSIRDKMMLSVLYESGCRKGEFRACKVKHVKFVDSQYCTLQFPTGKTGGRTIELVFSRMYLDLWIINHPQRLPTGETDPEAYLLIAETDPELVNGRWIYRSMSESNITKQIKKAAKRAGVTKPVNPHNFRATRATHLAANPHWSEHAIKEYQGWKQGSRVVEKYIRKVDTRNAVLKANNIVLDEDIPENKLKTIKCPNCHHIQPEATRKTASHCYLCGSPLNDDAKYKQKADMSYVLRNLIKASLNDPDLAEKFKEWEQNDK